jgi:predicted nucleic acid-binding protein
MIVYADTSFLVSLFYENDVNHKAAQKIQGKHDNDDFVVCVVHQLELPAAVRAGIFREKNPLPEYTARKIINRFDRAILKKAFQRKELDLTDSVNMARSLGDAHGWKKRHTSFDLWHLGAAWTLAAGAFLTFDKRQKEIARLLGMA